jgi:DNA replication factor GINS
MDLDELRSVRRTERQKDSLQHLRDSFYEDVAAYIEARKAERKRAAAAADDPFGDPDVGQLTDEISTAEDVVEAIYERRVGKVVKLASFAAADMSADKSGLTAEERALFEDLVDRIKQNRRTVLDTLAGEGGDAAATESPASDPAAAEPASAGDDRPTSRTEPPGDPPAPDDVLAAAMGGDDDGSASDDEAKSGSRTDAEGDPVPPEAVGDPVTDAEQAVPVVDGAETDGGDAAVRAGDVADPPVAGDPSPQQSGDDADTGSDGAADPHDDRVTLRITADVGRIYGVDEREYDLASEDVVRLPATNAGPLVERGAAERLE